MFILETKERVVILKKKNKLAILGFDQGRVLP